MENSYQKDLVWKQKYSKCEIALRLDQDIDLDIDNELAKRFIKN